MIVLRAGSFYAGDLIAFTTGLLISALFLILTLRARKLPGTPLANVIFAICGVVWSGAGFSETVLRAAGTTGQDTLATICVFLEHLAIVVVCIPVLQVWQSFARGEWQRKVARVFRWVAFGPAIVFALLFILAVWQQATPGKLAMLAHQAAMSAIFMLAVGALICLRRDTTPKVVLVPSLLMVAAAIVGGLAMITYGHMLHAAPQLAALFVVGAKHIIWLVILCAFLLFARFRYADLLIRYGVRILLAGVFASFLAVLATAPLAIFIHIVHGLPLTPAIHVFFVTMIAYLLLLSFTFVDDAVSASVNRWLFRSPDFQAATRRLVEKLSHATTEPEISAIVEEETTATLELSSSQLQPAGGLTFEGGIESDPPDFLIPVNVGGRVTHVLRVSPGATRPGLVMHDLDYLRNAATRCGSRFDALREAMLLQQVTEAELRALQAQINPHFLFNSLNTIADLIVRNPSRAETMTLRLASVFRYVLAQSNRPATAVREEIEFLRTYLQIEEIRFGDRLQVDFQIDPEVSGVMIPSLILQPLVENALRHGLAPKIGVGHLWIRAQKQATQIVLTVEDDGVGSDAKRRGTGLTNVAERLRTSYQDRATLSLEPRTEGGMRAVIAIPL